MFTTNPISSPIKVKLINKTAVYKKEKGVFGGDQTAYVLKFINQIKCNYFKITPIYMSFKNISFADKLTYIVLECICYELLHEKRSLVLRLNCILTNVGTDGIEHSPLKHLIQDNVSGFLSAFDKEFSLMHYRKIVHYNEGMMDYEPSKVDMEVDTFLKPFNISYANRSLIAEVASELVANAIEHAKEDCLIDIDLTQALKKTDDNNKYLGINLVILNFSDKLLYSSLQEKYCDDKLLNERHKQVLKAYQYHESNYCDWYGENAFFSITAFQNKITGRLEKSETGGTGLKTLLRALENESDYYHCYALSGNQCVYFNEPLLSYDDEGWVGFNESGDYFTNIPNRQSIGYSSTFFPGTAYNLNFVLKREE